MNEPTYIASLPAGHDDPDSEFWIPEEHRDLYRATEVPTQALEAALNKLARELDQNEWLAAWENYRAEKERRLSPREYARWLASNTQNGDGVTPKVHSLSVMRDRDSDRFRHLNRRPGERRPLADTQVAAVAHQCRMQHLAPPPSPESVARTEEFERQLRTCSICGCTDQPLHEITPNTSQRQCEACRDLVPLLLAALAPVPEFPSRLGAILANLPAHAPRRRLAMTEEQLEAWVASDESWQDFIAGAEGPPITESPVVGRLRRFFGNKPSRG